MAQSAPVDLEKWENVDVDQTQPAPNMSPSLSRGEYVFGDSSRPFFTIYSKAAEEEDNKMVEGWRRDAIGILIFTGLFSAAIAALLTATVQDLRQNSQDISAFYLGNIYEVLADPNVTRVSTSSVAQPPSFSPPRYAVWVNSLWFLSLVMSLSCALWAISLHRWAHRYIRLTQPSRSSPEKRARMRAFFANGVDKMHIPWAVEGLPTLLHLSLFLFFSGLAIFLFNVDRGVFASVVWWIVLCLMVYGLVTLLPLIRHDSPYDSPISKVVWFQYAGIQYVTYKLLAFITGSFGSYHTWMRYRGLKDRYRGWMLGGMKKKVEEMTSEQSPVIDLHILRWTISALGDSDDYSLERFFEAIPGLFNSKIVDHLERNFPWTDLKAFGSALDGFMGRTLSSNSVPESVKSRRVTICRDIMSMIPFSNVYAHDNLRHLLDQAPVSIERLQAMARWFNHFTDDVSYSARIRVAKNLARVEERDDRWIVLAREVYGLSECELRHKVALGGDNVLLAMLIDVTRQAIHSHELELVDALTHFDIRRTLPVLQHDFCALWNEFVEEARIQGSFSIPTQILSGIRRLYVDLHQDTDAAPTAFSASTDSLNLILLQPSSYPLCNIASHRHLPNASPYCFTSGGSTASQVKEESITPRPPSLSDPTMTSEIRESSQPPAVISLLPVHTSPCPTDASPLVAVTAALQDIHPAATLSHPLEGTTQRDTVAPSAEPNVGEVLSTVSTPGPTPTPAPVPASIPTVLSESLASSDAGAVPAPNPLLPASSLIGFSIPASPPPSRVIPSADAELLALSTTTPSRPTGNVTLPRLRARGLVNTGRMCFLNAVLQLLVRSPLFWNLFRELDDLKWQRGSRGPETGGVATPLVDATVRFFGEFALEEKEQPQTQQQPQQTARGEPRKVEEEKKENKDVGSFEPTYMYDAMKEKRLLKALLDGKHEDAEEFLGLYLDALDEELIELYTYISTNKPASTPSVEELGEGTQSAKGQTEGKRDYTASSVESPISRIFGGRSRSTVRVPNQPDTVTIKAWRSLKLYIQPDSVHTIQDALAHVTQRQLVQTGQSGSSDASQEMLLETLPPVLVLHLERFLYDAAADGIVKISKFIQFAPGLEIPVEIMAPISGKSAEPVHYKLYGVLYHHGESSGSGHYTVDVLHLNEDNGSEEAWLHIDDEAVSTVRHDDVIGDHDNERVDDQCAYMLFYYRTAPA